MLNVSLNFGRGSSIHAMVFANLRYEGHVVTKHSADLLDRLRAGRAQTSIKLTEDPNLYVSK